MTRRVLDLRDKYNELLRACAVELKKCGFRRQGSTLRRKVDGAWQIVGFQKSRKTSGSEILFRVNVGICNDRLREFFGCEGHPTVEDAHWCRRLKPDDRDEWWRIHKNTSAKELAAELAGILCNTTLPLLEELSSEGNLAVYWSTGESEGLTDAQRLMNLLVLLSTMGRANDSVAIREELVSKSKGKPWEAAARSVLSQLEEFHHDRQ